MKAKFGCNPSILDPIKDLGGVLEDIYTSFFNLQNHLLAHAPMESNDIISVEKYLDQNPPKFDMIDPLDPNHSKIEAIFDAIENLTIEYDPFSKVPQRFWDQLDALNTYFQVAEMSKTPTKKQSYTQMLLIWDTGASIGLTPYQSDFIDYQELDNVSVKDIVRQNKVLGVGTVMWKFITREGREVFLPSHLLPR